DRRDGQSRGSDRGGWSLPSPQHAPTRREHGMTTVCIAADTIGYPEGGGHFWAYLNWAIGFRDVGCDVIWLEQCDTRPDITALVAGVRQRLARYGFGEALVVCDADGETFRVDGGPSGSDTERVWDADLLANFRYATSGAVTRRFRRTALVDIDPGLLQLWL